MHIDPDDGFLTIDRPTPEVLRETARYHIHDADRAIAERQETIAYLEKQLRHHRQGVVRLRNRRAEWARLLR